MMLALVLLGEMKRRVGGQCISRDLLLVVLTLGVLISPCTAGTVLNEYVAHYEPVLIAHHDTHQRGHKLVSKAHFSAHGRDFHLHLETSTDIFLPGFKVYVVGKGGVKTHKSYPTKNIVRGYIEDERNSAVHGHILDGIFRGVIRSQGETYHVEPITNHLPPSSHHNRIVYKDSDVNYDLLNNTTCSSTLSPKLRNFHQKSTTPNSFSSKLDNHDQQLKKRAVDENLNTCIMAVVADYEFFSNIGNGQESTTVDEMTLHIMQSDEIYRRTAFIGPNGDFSGFGVALHSALVYTDPVIDNPLSGSFSVDELLEAFSEANFDNVCLGHLFTYRDFQGTIGLAYLGDPNGQFAGGICQKRTTTSMGPRNLNTGFTSLLNFGRRLPLAVSIITTAHEIGHNHGSPHDPAGECSPGPPDGNYIMYASATDGNRKEFSPCSRESMGRTIEANGGCFVQRPKQQECGNGIIEGDEECDCGSLDDIVECHRNDPCCTTNCTLKEGALCSQKASACCEESTCNYAPVGIVCLKGDSDIVGGGCQKDSECPGDSAECPPAPKEEDGTPCNDNKNTCVDGACTGSPCSIYGGTDCYCSAEEQLCHVCCVFDGVCTSTFDREGLDGIYVQPGYPCGNFSGYCTEEHTCKRVDNDDPLNKLKDILLDFTSIAQWLKDNWYWVLAGFGALIILIILLQLTYRRKKLPTETGHQRLQDDQEGAGRRKKRRRGRRQENATYGFYQTTDQDEPPQETTSLVRT